VGVSGSTDKNDPFYGLYLFKHRFGGDFIEYLGEFDYVFKQGAYTYYLKWHAFKRRVARRFIRLYYQRVVK
jgi:lipid II:glycine glycyltransferase (peptidoglycan interpeptide bridge formation enzyme)